MLIATLLASAVLFTLPASAAQPAPDTAAVGSPRYELAGGCYTLRPAAAGAPLSKAGGTYRATGSGSPQAFRLQATDLGSYLLYDPGRQFLAAAANGAIVAASQPSAGADWRVREGPSGTSVLSLPSRGKVLAFSPGTGQLTLADPSGGDGPGGRFTFVRSGGCATYPEAEISATGRPSRGKTPFGEVSGLLDAHTHMMAFEFFGGRAHCGRPWHRYGVPYALRDCPDHFPYGAGAILENTASFGNPLALHDPVGWPTFKDWPNHESLTHEQIYYKWLERAWMGGLRVFVNLLVENKVLCDIYPLKQNSCDEMDSIRLQAKRIRELENYIDAQSGGPGKGWFRIVTDPFEARRVVNEGKLAVVLGIETSEPFGCRVLNERPLCDKAGIDRGLDEVYALGVRDIELINKFDNALAGVAGDSGSFGVFTNAGNKLSTGKYWQMQRCAGPPDEADREPIGLFTHNHDDLIGNGLEALLPKGQTPVYPGGPLCNARGLTDLGEHMVRRMIAKGMMVDPDHLSVLARKKVMSLLEAARHSGAVSSHGWSTPDVVPRIYKLGGVITPYAGDTEDFVKAWKAIKPKRDSRFFFGFGYGADTGGLGTQGGPRHGANPVTYPFKSYDGAVTFHRQKTGLRVFDINTDGTAHYGLYADWIEDLRKVAGNAIVNDMARGSEAYLQMWERTVGVPAQRCRGSRGRLTRRGLGRLRLTASSHTLLRRAGQPGRRIGRAWRYCVAGRRNRGARVQAVLTPSGRLGLLASTARGHRAGGIGRGASARRLRRATRAFGRGVRIRSAGRGARVVYGVRRGRVTYVGVATRSVARSRGTLRRYLRMARLR
jgi:microsomal dipeptidase-like Zn-dependent dipeptidase